MIELIPAIDLINGQCVRLTKGDYDQKKSTMIILPKWLNNLKVWDLRDFM